MFVARDRHRHVGRWPFGEVDCTGACAQLLLVFARLQGRFQMIEWFLARAEGPDERFYAGKSNAPDRQRILIGRGFPLASPGGNTE